VNIIELNSTNPSSEEIIHITTDIDRESTQTKVVAYDINGDSH